MILLPARLSQGETCCRSMQWKGAHDRCPALGRHGQLIKACVTRFGSPQSDGAYRALRTTHVVIQR